MVCNERGMESDRRLNDPVLNTGLNLIILILALETDVIRRKARLTVLSKVKR